MLQNVICKGTSNYSIVIRNGFNYNICLLNGVKV